MKRSRGFTLIETLVALVVAAMVAGVVLALVRGLYLRAEQARTHAEAVQGLINDSVRMKHVAWREGIIMDEGSTWRLTYTDTRLPPLDVTNFELQAQIVPPVAAAYTPFQRFGLRQERYELWFLAPGLKPPGGFEPPAGMTPPTRPP